MKFKKIGINKIEFYTKDNDVVAQVRAIIDKNVWEYYVIPTLENVSILLSHAIGTDFDKLNLVLAELSNSRAQGVGTQLISTSVDNTLSLREYQIEDLKFLSASSSAANFSEQRTGKTPTTLLTIKNLGLKTIVICPASLSLLSWQPQVQKWLGIEPIILFKNSTSKKGLTTYKPLNKTERIEVYNKFFFSDNSDVLIVSKDTWKQDFNDIDLSKCVGKYIVAVDEAHILKAHKSTSKTTKQVKGILALAKYASYKYALSGTPASNHPSDVYGILHFLDPKRFTSWYQFVDYFWGFDYFRNPKPHFRDWYKGESQLREWLVNCVAQYSVMHKQKEVMQWLPDKIYEKVNLPMLPKQAQMYYEIMIYMQYEGELTQSILTQLHWLRQTANYGAGQSNKIEWIVEYIKENPDEKLLILSNYSNGTLPFVEESFIQNGFSYAKVVGAVSQGERQQIISDIQSNKVQHLIANITCLKEGIQLDSIDTVIFMDRAFSPSDNEQVEARFMPPTLDGLRGVPKKIIDLISESPVDVSIFKGTPIYKRLKNTLTDKKIIKLIENKVDITQYLNTLGKDWNDFLVQGE